MRITFGDVQRNVAEIANRQEYTIDVLYELMAAYGRSASSITKLRNGVINLAQDKNSTVLQRGVVYLKHVKDADSYPAEVEKLEQDPLTVRFNPRFLIATDFKSFAAKDTKKGNTLEIKWEDIDRNVDFFYGWTGDEVTDEKTEAVADRRAADKMKELYYEIERVNRNKLAEKGSTFRHELNVFFTRLLFCFFAEDTKVFSKENTSIFTTAIKDYTQADGSDLHNFLNTMFSALDSEDKSSFTSPFSKFPYVNGTLFDTKRDIVIPRFNAQARKYILDCGSLNWAEINPDIFGSMFQSIVDEEYRSTHGQHYTSVPNIMKTIEPLFLDELREEFDKHYDNLPKLTKLLDRISKIKVFDPACGSGNFLIIAYKELRKIEHAIIDRLYEEDFKKAALAGKLSTRIELDNFYGIEIDDFACEVAVLSLYLAKHQMNIEFEKQFGKEIKLIPLKDKANIVLGNSARLNWQVVCPNIPHPIGPQVFEQSKLLADEYEQSELLDNDDLRQETWDEIYLIGNPPYYGYAKQDSEQKKDVAIVFNGESDYKKLDYIACWFEKASNYIQGTDAKFAFVSTNSITQGEQVSLLWPRIFNKGLEIGFAYTSFKWDNNATSKAGVTVVIICIQSISSRQKRLFSVGVVRTVNTISPYLIPGVKTVISTRNNVLSSMMPKMIKGCSPGDDGWLLMTENEMTNLLENYPIASQYVKKYIGADEFINGTVRYCILVNDKQYYQADQIPILHDRFEHVRDFRLKSKKAATRLKSSKPYSFDELKYKDSPCIIFPQTSSENRAYIPIGFLDSGYVVSNAARIIYDADEWLFAVLTSRMHNVWTQSVAGRLETRIQYSNTLCYNNFPIKILSKIEEDELRQRARKVLFARENHSEKTLAQMYAKDKIPEDLYQAHHELDLAVDKLYRLKPYESDEERLADLFALYEQMTAEEK